MTKSKQNWVIALVSVLAVVAAGVGFDYAFAPEPVPFAVQLEAVEGRTPEERHQRRLDKIEEERQRRLLDKELPKPPGPLQQLLTGGIIGSAVNGFTGTLALIGMAPRMAILMLWLVVIGVAVWIFKGVLGIFRK